MKRRYDVMVVGDYTIDMIFTGLDGFPAPGKEVVGSGFAMVPGETYNAAIAMHRLGVKVGWAGDFGNDEFSRQALRQVRAEGLDEALFVRHKRPYRRITVAASYPDDRAFITYYDPEPTIPAAIKALLTASARYLYIPGFYAGPFLTAGNILARCKGMRLIMDGNSHDDVTLDKPAVRKALQKVDILLPNTLEARRMTGVEDLSKAIQVLNRYCSLVVVKDGAGGAYACCEGTITHAPALPIKPLDTTGAGDCFNAGFIKAYLDGKPLMECLRWGNIVGGLSTQGYGATGRRITPADVAHWEKDIAKNPEDG